MRRLLLPSLAALALGVAGCGGGNDDKPGRTATVPANAPIEVVADEYSFDPETVVVEAGGRRAELTLVLRNEGALAHNLRVFRGGDEIGGTPTFQGGQPRRGTVAVEPGEYELICTVGNHADLGMTGKLQVK